MTHQHIAAMFVIVALVAPGFAKAVEPDVGAASTITNSLGMKLAQIPAGTFLMGSPRNEAERDDKEVRHEVTLTKPFHLGAYEVTQPQYVEVMNGVRDGNNRSTFQGNDLPIENVEWRMAQAFCERLSARPEEIAAKRKYRLPTEAEWEYACRAGTATAFHCGDSLSSDQANFNGNFPAGGGETGKYLRQTAPAGSYPPNAFGLYDMHGNVAEWCSDWYDPEYYLNSPEEDPLGPPFGVVSTKFTNNGNQNFFVVIRGGCWVDEGRACRSAYRYRAMPNTQYRLIGFRVACDVEQE